MNNFVHFFLFQYFPTYTFTLLVSNLTPKLLFFFSPRLLYSGSPKGLGPRHQVELTFGTRTGTRNGIEAHLFRVDTRRDLAAWTRHLVQGSHNAAVLMKEIACCEYHQVPKSRYSHETLLSRTLGLDKSQSSSLVMRISNTVHPPLTTPCLGYHHE